MGFGCYLNLRVLELESRGVGVWRFRFFFLKKKSE